MILGWPQMTSPIVRLSLTFEVMQGHLETDTWGNSWNEKIEIFVKFRENSGIWKVASLIQDNLKCIINPMLYISSS